eukprot:3642358-Pleurochrysis_carterae.AAC.1
MCDNATGVFKAEAFSYLKKGGMREPVTVGVLVGGTDELFAPGLASVYAEHHLSSVASRWLTRTTLVASSAASAD